LRVGTIQSQEFDLAVKNLLQDATNYFVVVEIDQNIVQQSVDVIRRNALRGYDAVQLACGLALNSSLVSAGESPLTFITADKVLLSAASNEGLQADDPNSH
jgi:predicted nucleic acid-binding protein